MGGAASGRERGVSAPVEVARLLSRELRRTTRLSPSHRRAAVIVAKDGRLFSAPDLEGVGITGCAERAALYIAHMAGVRHFECGYLAAATGASPLPCGACLQVLHELAPGLELQWSTARGDVSARVEELLPDAFGPESLRPARSTAR